MNCPLCSEEFWLIRFFLYHGDLRLGMRLMEYHYDFHDPANQNGHGQVEGKAWGCERCGYVEPLECIDEDDEA